VPPDRDPAPTRRAEFLLAPLIFALLLVATLGAFAAAQRLKREPLILDKLTLGPLVRGEPLVSPNGDGCREAARISFRLSVDDRGRVEIIDKDERTVRTLPVDVLNKRGRVAESVPAGGTMPAYMTLRMRWNGRDGSGRVVSTGPYRLRVVLIGEDRSLVPLERIRVHTRERLSAAEAKPACPGRRA
jgi:hypothetical protein